MEGLLIIPKLLENSDEDSIMKDFLLYVIVFGFHRIGIFMPRKIFIIFAVYVLLCEILNNLTYKIILPNKKLLENWTLYQNEKNIKIVKKYLNEKNILFSSSSSHRVY